MNFTKNTKEIRLKLYNLIQEGFLLNEQFKASQDSFNKPGFTPYMPPMIRQSITYPECRDLKNWKEKVDTELREIVDDFSIQALLAHNLSESSILMYREIAHDLLINTLKILTDIYSKMKPEINFSLTYTSKQSILQYEDLICRLKKDSNMDLVCKFIFEHCDFGESVDTEDIEKYLLGDVNQDRKATKAVNAAREVNKKTNILFGFPIFYIGRGQISLVNPTLTKLKPCLENIS